VLHLVRNAVDHGVEPSAERAQRGKRTSATVALRVYTAGRELCVEVNDDGRGLDRARILAKAVANAMIDAGRAAQLRDEEAFMLVFEPGFSTAEQVSDISGRGVGMDVVRHAVEELGGSVHLRSTLGAGTTVRINLPRVSAPTNAAGFSSPPAQLSSTAVMKTVRYGS